MRQDHGFSLIELMVVVALVAILAAMAIPAYSNVRRVAFNGAALTDLARARTLLVGTVPNLPKGSWVIVGPGGIAKLPGLRVTRNVRMNLSISAPSSQATQNFTVTTKHTKGSATYQTNQNGKITATGAVL